MLFDRLNYTMDSFMKAQSNADKAFLTNLFEKPAENDMGQIVIPIREKGDNYCIELELDQNRSMKKLTRLIKAEYDLDTSEFPLVSKLPDILIRLDREVQRLKTGDQLEFVRVTPEKGQQR